MLQVYRDIVYISCLNHKDMGHLDVVSSLHVEVLGVAARAYRGWPQPLVHWPQQHERQHPSAYGSVSSHGVVHALDAVPLGRD